MSSLKSPLFPIFLTVFVDVMGLTLVLPLLPFYAEHYGASPLVVGTLIASYAACQLVSSPVLGHISDRVGRKPTLLASQMGTFVGLIVLGMAGSLWMLFLGRIIDGLTAGNLTIAQAYISDVTKPEQRTRAFGFIGIAFGMGFLFGPLISGLLARRFGYSAPAFGAAVLSAGSILATATMLPRVPPPSSAAAEPAAPGAAAASEPAGRRTLDLGRFLRRPVPRRRLLVFFAFTLSFSTMIGGLALYLERRFGFDVEKVGYVFAGSGLIGALIQGGLMGRLVKRFGERKLSLYGFLALAVGTGFLGAAYGLPALVALIAISGFGLSVTRPALTTLVTKAVGRHEQGAALGASQSFASISHIVGPILAGWLIGQQRLAAYGLASASFALVGVLLSAQREPVVG